MENTESVIIRSNFTQNDLLSCFSLKTKEPRVTAVIGYLLSKNHEGLLELFGISDFIHEVKIEKTITSQRCDIIVCTSKKIYLIEAKLYNEDPYNQLIKQNREYKYTNKGIQTELIALTNYMISRKGIKYINWIEFSEKLLISSSNPNRVLSEELNMHLQNQGIIPSINQFEIYAREVNNEPNLSFFLKCHFYMCYYEKNSDIAKCNYFAPHFGKKITEISPGIAYGMGYVARIENIVYVDNINDFNNVLQNHLKEKKLINQYKSIVHPPITINKRHTILLLAEPHLVFNPPIQKDNLQDGSGWLSKRYFTFDDLFTAAKI